MMAAIRASEIVSDVTLFEKNSGLGAKLLLSGKGRCNLTNACDLESFLERFSGNGEFLRAAFHRFFNDDLIRFFEERGLTLKTERQLRVFPLTDKSSSVLDVLKKALQKNKVKVINNTSVKDVVSGDGKVQGVVLSNGSVIASRKIILATGGVSYKSTGSTGFGIDIAKKFGHRIEPLRAGLVPLEVTQRYPKFLEGLALKNISIKISNSKKEIKSPVGELMFTDYGVSGPLVLSLGAQIGDWLNVKERKRVYMDIDLKPALSDEQLDNRLLREFKLNPKRSINNILHGLLPQRLVNIFIEILKIPPDKKVSYVTHAERRAIVVLFKGFRLYISRLRPVEEGMVTRGGISLKDINPRTMESKIIKGLYFSGEMIDVDADTGGFNLQAAFSTGYLAGESAALN